MVLEATNKKELKKCMRRLRRNKKGGIVNLGEGIYDFRKRLRIPNNVCIQGR